MKKMTICGLLTLVSVFVGGQIYADGVSASSEGYVKKGLVAYWDGIDNTLKNGVRSHDAAATTWCDLSGNGNDFAIPSFVKIESNAMLSLGNKDKKPDMDVKAAVKFPTKKLLKGLSTGPDAPSFTVEVVVQRVRWTDASNPWRLQMIFSTPRGSIGYRGGKSDFFYVLHPVSTNKLVAMNINHALGKSRGEMAEIQTASVTFANGKENGFICLDDGFEAALDLRTDGWSTSWMNDFKMFDNPTSDIRIFAIRVYNRELTAEERVQNAACDKVRFTRADTPSERAIPQINLTNTIGKIRRELHSSSFAPSNYGTWPEEINDIKALNMWAGRTHDWALADTGQRIVDYFHLFPLMHLNPKDPKNYLLEVWDANANDWGAPATNKNQSTYVYTKDETNSRVRLTWLWQTVGRGFYVDCPISCYEQKGLVAWYDGICNVSKDGEHDSEATIWCDLSGNNNHLTFLDSMSRFMIGLHFLLKTIGESNGKKEQNTV